MALTAFSGPLVVFGQVAQAGDYNPDIGGASLFSNGCGVLDTRGAFGYYPGETQSSVDYGWIGCDNISSLSAVPYTASTVAISATAAATSATLSLVGSSSATTGVYVTQSFVRSDTGLPDASNIVAIDALASVTASFANGVMTITTNSGMPVYPGMTIISTSGTISSGTVGSQVFSQLTSIGTYSSTAQGYTGTYQTNGTLTATSGTVVLAYQNVGQCGILNNIQTPGISVWNPASLVGRAVSITSSAGATATTATVSGYDVYGYPVVENITISAGATANGKKAFKYIKSVVLNASDSGHTYSVGTTDIIGFPIRTDCLGDVIINSASGSLINTTIVTASTGYLPADKTTPSATTGDIRGTYAGFTSSTGANKLVFRQGPPPYTFQTSTGLYGSQYSNF